jgi:hypothetical protein
MHELLALAVSGCYGSVHDWWLRLVAVAGDSAMPVAAASHDVRSNGVWFELVGATNSRLLCAPVMYTVGSSVCAWTVLPSSNHVLAYEVLPSEFLVGAAAVANFAVQNGSAVVTLTLS